MRIALFISGLLVGIMATALANSPDGLYGSVERGVSSIRGEEAVASRLADKASALDAREKSLDARSADLEAEKERILSDIERSEAIRVEILALIETLDARNAEQVLSQVKVFEKMRGAQAAAVLELTDETIALAILQGMRPDKSAKILAAMNPETAARLTEKLSTHPLTGVELP